MALLVLTFEGYLIDFTSIIIVMLRHKLICCTMFCKCVKITSCMWFMSLVLVYLFFIINIILTCLLFVSARKTRTDDCVWQGAFIMLKY